MKRTRQIKLERPAVTVTPILITNKKISTKDTRMRMRGSNVKSNESKSVPDSSEISVPNTVPPLSIRNLFRCEKCSRSFTNQKYLLKHNQSHRNLEDSVYVCGFCFKKFMTNVGLSNHISKHTEEKVFSCNLCNKGFHFSAELNVHMASHQTKRPHQCKKCDKNYKLKKHLTRHQKTHNNNIMLPGIQTRKDP